jgi:hypothetical protein
LRNVEQTNSIESNLKKLVFGRVDLVPSYGYVALDTAGRESCSSPPPKPNQMVWWSQ